MGITFLHLPQTISTLTGILRHVGIIHMARPPCTSLILNLFQSNYFISLSFELKYDHSRFLFHFGQGNVYIVYFNHLAACSMHNLSHMQYNVFCA